MWRTRKKQTESARYLIFSLLSVEQIGKSYQSSLAVVVQKKRKWLFEFHFSGYLCHSMLSSGTLCCLHWVMRLFFSLSDERKAHIRVISRQTSFLHPLDLCLLLKNNGGQPTNADHCFLEGMRERERQTDREINKGAFLLFLSKWRNCSYSTTQLIDRDMLTYVSELFRQSTHSLAHI